jgi:2-polyprenyl-6-methoxyphenol hydroxylase-like FAD-dependent oxidoreductase
MSQLKVLIVGASIAGPTAAYWFAKAGAKVTIIERFPELRTNGQNIDIRISGVSVMRKMVGMEAAVNAKKLHIPGLCFVRDNGKPYGTIKASGNPDKQTLLSEYEIYRGDLAKILFNLTKDNGNVQYIFGEQVASIQQNEKGDGPATVKFANGLPTAEYDLVVACDGATSRTRAMGLGCGARDYVKPSNSWAAYFTIKTDLLKGSSFGHAFNAPGGRFVALGHDLGVTRATVMAVNRSKDVDASMRFRDAAKGGEVALKQFVAQHLQGVGWKVNEIVKDMMESEDFYANEIVQINTPSLSKGRFVLVGDAGYASTFTGTGTTLALTGAYLLAGEVAKHKGDIAAGLMGYEERMTPFIEKMQKVSPVTTSFLAPQSATGVWIRNHVFALITWSGLIEFANFFAGAFASTSEYPLPEYEWEN